MKSVEAIPSESHVGRGVASTIFLGIAAFLIPQILVGILISVWASLSGKDPQQVFDNSSIEFVFTYTLGIAAFEMLIIYAAMARVGGLKRIGFKNVPLAKLLSFVPAYIVYFSILIAVFALIEHFKISVDLDQEQVIGYEGAKSQLQLIFAFISLVILAPVTEEILFRGFLFKNLSHKLGFWLPAILVSGLFALAHGQLNVGIDTFLLGMTACYLVWKTKSIYPAILLHMLKNSVAYIFLFIVK